MKQVLVTTDLVSDKSVFVIELVKHQTGVLYVEIVQNINDQYSNGRSIKINPSIITDLIQVLQNYDAKIAHPKNHIIKHLTEGDREKIKTWYLKGVSIKDLAMQTNQSTDLIEMVLRNAGIAIVSNALPKYNYRWYRKK